MLYVYLAATIVGALLLGGSFVLGGHHADVSSGGDGHADGHPAAEGESHGFIGSLALSLLSLRLWTYLLAFGGATGLLLRGVAHVNEPMAAVVSAGVGIATGALARALIARASSTGNGDRGTVSTGDLVGLSGAVLVPFARGATGKVRVRVRDSLVDVLATTEDGRALDPSDEVLIVEMRDGAALVTRNPGSDAPR